MSGHDYDFVNHLVDEGWDRRKAREISEELGIELWSDRKLIKRGFIDKLNFLTPDEKQKLWALVSSLWGKTPYTRTRQLHALLVELRKE